MNLNTCSCVPLICHGTKKTVLGMSDQVRHNLGCTVAEETLGDYTIYEAKTKALTNCMVTVQPICAYVFAYRSLLSVIHNLLLSLSLSNLNLPNN